MTVVTKGLGGYALVTGGLGDPLVQGEPQEGVVYRSGLLHHVGQPGNMLRTGRPYAQA
jgi:hypothetical protein